MTRALIAAALTLSACSPPQVEVATARAVPPSKPLNCEGDLPPMFATKADCIHMKRIEQEFGDELEGRGK